jgi:hypothetical protein
MKLKKLFKKHTQIAVLDFNTFQVNKYENNTFSYDYISAIAFGDKAVNLKTGVEIDLKLAQIRWKNLCKVYPALKESSVVLVADGWINISFGLNSYWDNALGKTDPEDYPF